MPRLQGTRTSKSGKTTVNLRFNHNNGIVMGLQSVNERAPINLQKYMERRAIEAENYMKTHHPWKNRSHRAEDNLHADVKLYKGGNTVRMELKHGDVVWPWYGYYLEYGSSHARPYPIIGPTQRVFGPRLLNELNLSELYRFTGNPKK